MTFLWFWERTQFRTRLHHPLLEGPGSEDPMRLAEFILSNMEHIVTEWETFARNIAPGAKMEPLALRDHAAEILLATVQDMTGSQSPARDPVEAMQHMDTAALNGASELHAIGRLGSGFDLLAVVSEYRALRSSVLELWRDTGPKPHVQDVDDLTRFNASIDQSLTKAVSSYTRRVDQSRDLFLSILGHDLRNPLNSIGVSAQLLPALAESGARISQTASQISGSVNVMGRMISDLLDYTRTRLGAGMPVSPVPMDLGELGREVFVEYRTGYPSRDIRFESDLDVTGNWDPDRLRQMISNLLGNAVQHGSATGPVYLRLTADASTVTIKTHNGGPPIPPGELAKIFEPLVRGSSAAHPPKNRPGSIGLGLYIAREIARSHDGRIEVVSEPLAGTTFTVHLPRHIAIKSAQPILDEKHIQTM